ncbi:MAG: glycosyltransferase family 2 protein [Cyanobacteria bacterium HKST-UBA02]|nr:glycosyltransferase family 2 protein [Cyanobacteria bacterium HKST-UBA02]
MTNIGDRQISVVLPVCNQADHIERVVRLHHGVLSQGLEGSSFEIILVENGSTDESFEICARIATELDNVFALRSPRTGWGAAIQLGLEKSSGDILCYASSARVESTVLLDFIRKGLEHPDSVIQAIRRGHDNKLRSLASRVYNLECRILFDIRTKDINGNPKVFPRKFERLLELREDGFIVDLEFNVVCREAGYPVIEMPVPHTNRHGGRSMTSFSLGSSLYVEALRIWTERLGKTQTRLSQRRDSI